MRAAHWIEVDQPPALGELVYLDGSRWDQYFYDPKARQVVRRQLHSDTGAADKWFILEEALGA